MITQFKIYEQNINRKPQIGDYVIVTDKHLKVLNYFLKDNIGKIIDIVDGYIIEFEKEVPKHLSQIFNYNNIKNTREYYTDEIEYFSPNREDCILFIQSSKFNV